MRRQMMWVVWNYIAVLLILFTEPICVTQKEHQTTVRNISRLLFASEHSVIHVLASDGITDYEDIILELSEMDSKVIIMDYTQVIAFLGNIISTSLRSNGLGARQCLFSAILFGQRNNTIRLLQEVDDLDQDVGFGIVVRHFSMWLWLSDNTTELPVSTKIDNLAVVSHDNYQEEVKTLMWKPEGREWNTVTGIDLASTDIVFPNIKHGFNGHVLKAVLMEWVPFMLPVRSARSKAEGLSVEIVDALAGKFNFTYEIVAPADRSWGIQLQNGSWTGVIGMMERKEADLNLAPFVDVKERSAVMSFAYPLLHSKAIVVYKVSKAKWNLEVYTTVFRFEVIICSVVTLVGCVFLMIVFEQRTDSDLKTQIPGIFMLGIAVQLQKSEHFVLHTNSARVLLWFWLMFSLMMISVYTSNITAILTVDKQSSPFSSLEELALSNDFDVGLGEASFLRYVLQDSDDTVFKTIWKKVTKSLQNGTVDYEGERDYLNRRLQEGGFAMLSGSMGLQSTISGFCGMNIMKGQVLSSYASFTFPRNSPLPSVFNSDLQRIKESGLMAQMQKKWSAPDNSCSPQEQEPVSAITIRGFFPVVILVLLLAFVGVVVVFIETLAAGNHLCKIRPGI